MDWVNNLLPRHIGMVGVPLVLYLMGLLLSRDRTHKAGYKIGRFLTLLGQKKVGGGWEKIEDKAKTTIADFIEGIYEGLDSDDNEEAPKNPNE